VDWKQIDYLMFKNEGHVLSENRITCYNAIPSFSETFDQIMEVDRMPLQVGILPS
jgi:hypothetical protein